MRFVKTVLLGLVVLVVVLVAVGLMMPDTFKVERSVQVAAPAAKVYALIVDPRQWKQWSAWNQRDPGMAITYSGPAAGVGATWAWDSKSEGKGSMTFTRAVPDNVVDYALSIPGMGFASKGSFVLAPGSGTTRVTWSSEGNVGKNPVMRLMVPFMDRVVGADFEAGLANLKQVAEKG